MSVSSGVLMQTAILGASEVRGLVYGIGSRADGSSAGAPSRARGSRHALWLLVVCISFSFFFFSFLLI